MRGKKVPNMPDGNRPDHVVSFISNKSVYDIDGKQYTVDVVGDKCTITDDFNKKILYDGGAPVGPYGIEGAQLILGILMEL